MIEHITKYKKANTSNAKFSLLIPTWNNLPYLQNCIESVKENSHFSHQIIVIVNEGNDGTVEWLNQQSDIDFVHAKQNVGICYALNIARQLADTEYLVYINDDMYLLPDWDEKMYSEIQSIGHKKFMLSCTMVEPTNTSNPCVVVKDYGQDLESFQKDQLLKDQQSLCRGNWTGSTWPPNIIHVDMWDLVGGMSIEFSPGMYSDPDLAKKLYEAGVRLFKGKGDSLAYHFGSKSTRRVRRNRGRQLFLIKWGMTSNTFMNKFLKIGSVYSGPVADIELGFFDRVVNRLKRVKNCF